MVRSSAPTIMRVWLRLYGLVLANGLAHMCIFCPVVWPIKRKDDSAVTLARILVLKLLHPLSNIF